jgi:hypothetical protein
MRSIENECWLEGIKACEEKKPRESNPYIKASNGEEINKSIQWFGGYDIAAVILERV